MSVLRFEPFRDPFERLFSMAATGARAVTAADLHRAGSAPARQPEVLAVALALLAAPPPAYLVGDCPDPARQ